jgi:hypothetical protein
MSYNDPTTLINGDTITATHWTQLKDSIRADANTHFQLGGSKTSAIPFGGSAQDAIDSIEVVIPSSTETGFGYKVVCQVITQNATTTVTPSLYNVTDSTTTWTGSAGTQTSWGSGAEQISSNLTLAAGKRYKLQFTKNNDTYEAWGIGHIRRLYA